MVYAFADNIILVDETIILEDALESKDFMRVK